MSSMAFPVCENMKGIYGCNIFTQFGSNMIGDVFTLPCGIFHSNLGITFTSIFKHVGAMQAILKQGTIHSLF